MKPQTILLIASCVFAFSGLGLMLTQSRTREQMAESNRKQIAEAKREVEERQRFQIETDQFTERAKANLENWQQSFMNEDMVAACFHGHVFNAKEMKYEITCDVGWKGYVPSLKVVCNQDRCTHEKYEALPQSPHQPLHESSRANTDGFRGGL
jgi:hypothetical protein